MTSESEQLKEALELLKRLTTVVSNPDDPYEGTVTLMNYSYPQQLRMEADKMEEDTRTARALYAFLEKLR